MPEETKEEKLPPPPELVEYIGDQYNPKSKQFETVDEWLLRIHPYEIAILYAAHHIHYLKQKDADKNIGVYRAQEQFISGNEPQDISIESQVPLLEPPFLKGMKHLNGTRQAFIELNQQIKTIFPYTIKNDVFFGAYTAITWFAVRSNSRPPEINPKNNGTSYELENLPANFIKVEERESNEFNKVQLQLLEEARTLVLEILEGIDELYTQYKEMPILEFSHNVFRTWQRIDDTFIDPEPEVKPPPEPTNTTPKNSAKAKIVAG